MSTLNQFGDQCVDRGASAIFVDVRIGIERETQTTSTNYNRTTHEIIVDSGSVTNVPFLQNGHRCPSR